MTVLRELSYNLAGTVSNLGLGVTGAKVRLYDYWNQASGLTRHFLLEQVTGSKGSFSFDVRKGIYAVEVVPGEGTRFARQSFERIKVTSNTECPVALKSGFILSGTVEDSQGKPLPNCQLEIFGIEPHVLHVTEPVNQDGSYSISLPPGYYYISLSYKPSAAPPDRKKKQVEHPTFLCPRFEMLELNKDTVKHLVLPELLKFDGMVTNTQGHPVLGVQISITALERPDNVFARSIPLEVTTTTRKDGKFDCRLKPGNYSIRLEPPADSNLAEKTINSLVVDSDRNRTYALDEGRRLSGQVHVAGEPVSNAMLTVFGASTRYVRITDEEGRYSFNIPGGSYEISLVLQPDSLRQRSDDLAPWTGHLPLADDTDLDIELDDGVLVSGRVLDPAKKIREGVTLAVYATRDGKFDGAGARQHPLAMGITGADGAYEFRLRPGKYWLVLNNQPSTGHFIEVTDGKNEGDLTVEDVCVLTFEVISEKTEKPIPNCLVSYDLYETGSDGDQSAFADLIEPVMTGDDGRCTVTMPTGIYSFHFHPPADCGHSQRHVRQLSVISDMTRRIKLAPQG